MKNKQQTAVEWLWRWFNDNQEATIEEGNNAFQQAKEMEKEHMIKFTNDYLDDDADLTAEQYYNETYEGGK
jgi:hypothetical protein